MTHQLNTRADLDALRGSPEHLQALRALRGSMTATVNVATYPDGYFDPAYQGQPVEPVWEEIESVEALTLIGLPRSEFVVEWNAVFPEDPMALG